LTNLACPICNAGGACAFEKFGHPICDCAACGHRYAALNAQPEGHVSTVYSNEYFNGGGAGYSDYLAEERLLRDRGKWYAKILAKHSKPGSILDVGAAAGFVLQGFIDSGWTGNGIEPNDTMASVARSRLGLEVWTGMMENLAGDLQFDAVSMIQVLPHFVDPKHAMSVVARILKPGGLLLVETWNRQSLTARLMGQNWHEYSPPSVLHWFDPDGVNRLANSFGLTEISRGRPAKKILTSHAKSLLKHTMCSSAVGRIGLPLLSLIPDGWALPYPAEDLFYMVLRKNA
jgi:ubiquinone/menaquinone biosynthesis C-methylase UbiE